MVPGLEKREIGIFPIGVVMFFSLSGAGVCVLVVCCLLFEVSSR